MKTRSTILVLFSGLIISQITFAEVKQSIYSIPGDSIRAWLKIDHVPAVGIGTIENGKVKSVHVYGELKPGVPAPVDAMHRVFTNGDSGDKLISTILKASQIDLAPQLAEYMDEFR